MGYKYIFMYNAFDESGEEGMSNYLRGYFENKIFINDRGQLWVREDVYEYVFAVINSHAVYDEKFEVLGIEDCQELKQRMIDRDDVTYRGQ